MISDPERYGWNKAAIRLAADIAREMGVSVGLERDGSIKISPVENNVIEELRELLAEKG